MESDNKTKDILSRPTRSLSYGLFVSFILSFFSVVLCSAHFSSHSTSLPACFLPLIFFPHLESLHLSLVIFPLLVYLVSPSLPIPILPYYLVLQNFFLYVPIHGIEKAVGQKYQDFVLHPNAFRSLPASMLFAHLPCLPCNVFICKRA